MKHYFAPIALGLLLLLCLSFVPKAHATAKVPTVYASGPFCTGTGCDYHYLNDGSLPCNNDSTVIDMQDDNVYDTHGGFVGVLHAYESINGSTPCFSVWGGFRVANGQCITNGVGDVGNYNTQDEENFTRAINQCSNWVNTIMDELDNFNCHSIWIQGYHNGVYFAHKLISGGAGC